jgi:hypothetical protein
MTAAKLGIFVRRAIPNKPFEFGFAKFRDVLAQMEANGVITTGVNSKQALAVWLGNQRVPESPTQPGLGSNPRPSFPGFLRKTVWLAFVGTSPRGNRYINRITGEVRMACPEPPDHSGDWVEVAPVEEATQKQLAKSFIDAQGLSTNEEMTRSLDTHYWFHEFPATLRKHSPALQTQWNRHRTEHVVKHVAEWCDSHKVPPELVFDAPGVCRQSTPSIQATAPDLRDALLEAIAAMTLDELLDIRIPARHLIKAVRPDIEQRITGS